MQGPTKYSWGTKELMPFIKQCPELKERMCEGRGTRGKAQVDEGTSQVGRSCVQRWKWTWLLPPYSLISPLCGKLGTWTSLPPGSFFPGIINSLYEYKVLKAGAQIESRAGNLKCGRYKKCLWKSHWHFRGHTTCNKDTCLYIKNNYKERKAAGGGVTFEYII